MKYRKKPVECEIDAMQFRRDNIEEFRAWCKGKLTEVTIPRCINGIMKGKLEICNGINRTVAENDYAIKDDEGNFIIYGDFLEFEETFEPAE